MADEQRGGPSLRPLIIVASLLVAALVGAVTTAPPATPPGVGSPPAVSVRTVSFHSP